MAPSKHYSNAFTKHVDYEGGRHRGRLAHDEPLVCKDCGSFYAKRRWVRAEDPRAALIPAAATRVQCPACEAKAKQAFRLEPADGGDVLGLYDDGGRL